MKIKKLLLSVLLATTFISVVKAQNLGVFNGAQIASYYDLKLSGPEKTIEATAAVQSSITSKTTNGFLPVPPSGNVRVGLPAAGGGAFSLTNAKLNVTSSSGNFPVKFVAYGIEKSSPVSSLFFTISFNNTEATNGLVILGLGNGSTPIYTTHNQLTGNEQAGLFTAIQFGITADGISTRYRNMNATTGIYGYSTFSQQPVEKSGTAEIEIYANNSAEAKSYKKGNKVYNLPSKTYHIFVNGTALKSAGTIDIPATTEGAVGSNIDSFVINGSNNTAPTANSLTYSISNVKFGGLQ